MDYFNERVNRHLRYAVELPSWLPRNGLLYYDDLSVPRERALTGQRYRERDPGTSGIQNDPIEYTVIGGKRCIYKEGPYNGLTFDLPGILTDYTWGCWVYDVLGTCTNQQIFNLWNEDRSEKCYVSFKATDGTDRIMTGHWSYTQNRSLSWAGNDNLHVVGEWRFLYGWHGSGWFGPRMPPIEDGKNLDASMDSRITPRTATLLQYNQCFGVAVRGAFIYNRVITAAEGMAIYNGSKDET